MLDKLIIGVDNMVKALTIKHISTREHPDADLANGELSAAETKHARGLMRVNHSGEVCAQALYQGQALTAREQTNCTALQHAADEESEHLAWTHARITELGGKPSILNPLFYIGSLLLGATAGAFGDKWNLGFLAETERQVEAHLERHLHQLPQADIKSIAVVTQMQSDEAKHAAMACDLGAAELPGIVKNCMRHASKIMTKIAYHI